MTRGAAAAALLLALVLWSSGCGQWERSNPYDPAAGGQVDLAALLLGAWSRIDTEKNEVYSFRQDRSITLYDYQPGPAADSTGTDLTDLDRDAAYPQTVVVIYSGTYSLVDSRLSITYSNVVTTDPTRVPPTLPAAPRVFGVEVRHDELVLEALDGKRTYQRFD